MVALRKGVEEEGEQVLLETQMSVHRGCKYSELHTERCPKEPVSWTLEESLVLVTGTEGTPLGAKPMSI